MTERVLQLSRPIGPDGKEVDANALMKVKDGKNNRRVSKALKLEL